MLIRLSLHFYIPQNDIYFEFKHFTPRRIKNGTLLIEENETDV